MKKLLIIPLLFILQSCFYVTETKDVIVNETRPSVALKKYMYFKDLSSSIDKHRANIEVLKQTLLDSTVQISEYEKYQRRTELIGTIQVYNDLVSKYNSDMSKINYSFANVGSLPQSNLTPLPREYREYILTNK